MAEQDASLIQRFREGDEAAFRELFERYVDGLQRRVQRLMPTQVLRRHSVADVLQEARIVAFRRRADFENRGEGSFRNWLYGIVDHKMREALRAHKGTAKRDAKREVTRGQRLDTAQFQAKGPSPSQVAIASELADLARRALESLPLDYREVLRLAREERLSLREVAVRMGRSREAVKKLYGRALCRFKEAFDGLRDGRHE